MNYEALAGNICSFKCAIYSTIVFLIACVPLLLGSDDEPTPIVFPQLEEVQIPKDRDCNFQSQHNQDWFAVKNLFHGKTNGFYFDVGANRPKIISNTYYLDKCLGWKGVCVEPNPSLAALIRKERSCIVFNGCVTFTKSQLILAIPEAHKGQSGSNNDPDKQRHVEARIVNSLSEVKEGEIGKTVECAPISDLIKRFEVDHIDFMSLDVEGHEPQAIASFDSKIVPDIISVEISTGRIQRALTQMPLLAKGYQSVVPLYGDGIFMRHTPAFQFPTLTFPKTRYYSDWWHHLCMVFEKLPRPFCDSLGLKYGVREVEDRKLPISTLSRPSVEECQALYESGVKTNVMGHPDSVDWYILRNYYGSTKNGYYVDISTATKEGSVTYYMDKCLHWKGKCVAFTPEQAEAFEGGARTCDVVRVCLKQLCSDLGCKDGLCPTLKCSNAVDMEGCVNLKDISWPSAHVLNMDSAYAQIVTGVLPWAVIQSAEVISVLGDPKTNYKLLHWPLSLRGYGMVGTLRGSDIFTKRVASLARPHKVHPTRNPGWVHWMESEYRKQHVPDNVISVLINSTSR